MQLQLIIADTIAIAMDIIADAIAIDIIADAIAIAIDNHRCNCNCN